MCVKALRCDLEDTVAVVSQPVKAGTVVNAAGETLTALADIPLGHKIALQDMAAGELVYKYGLVPVVAVPRRPLPKGNGSTRTTSRILQRSCVTAMQKNFERKWGERYEQELYGL